MDIKDISFLTYGECWPEPYKLLYYTNDFFRLGVAQPNILYVCTSVCAVRIENAFCLEAPCIIPVSDSPSVPFVCYYTDGANIKVYVSEGTLVWLLVGNVYIQFRHTTYEFLKALIEKVHVFKKKK